MQVLIWNVRRAAVDVYQDLSLYLSTQTNAWAALVQEGPDVDKDIDYDLCMGSRLCLAASGVPHRGSVGILITDAALPWLKVIKRAPSAVAAVFGDTHRAIILVSMYLPSRRFTYTQYQQAIGEVFDVIHRARIASGSKHVHVILGGDTNIPCSSMSNISTSVLSGANAEDWASHEQSDRACLLRDLLDSCLLTVPLLPQHTWADSRGNKACLDIGAAAPLWESAVITVDEAATYIRDSDHLPLLLTLSKPKLQRKQSRQHISSWQFSQQNDILPIAKSWTCLDVGAYNKLISQQVTASPSIQSMATAINVSGSFTKIFPAPHEDPHVSSLYHKANLCTGSERSQLLSDAAATRRTRKRQTRLRQASQLTAGVWWQTQKIQAPKQVPVTLATDPDHKQHTRPAWPRMVQRYCQRLFGGPEKERLMTSALLSIARQHAAAHRQALAFTDAVNARLRFSFRDFHDAVRRLPKNKAVGTDGLSAELLLALNTENQTLLAHVLEQRMNGDDDPAFQATLAQLSTSQPESQYLDEVNSDDPWRTALALLLPKKPNPNTLQDFRSIHLLPILQKLYLKEVVCRLHIQVWDQILTNQYGARYGHQALQVIHSIKLLQEKCWEAMQGLVLIKLDIRKAFDRARRSTIMKSMLAFSAIDPRVLYALFREWQDPHIRASVSGQLSPQDVRMTVGLRQGGSDSSLAFVVAMDHAMRPAIAKWAALRFGIIIPGMAPVTHFLFVDDLIMVASSVQQVREMYADSVKCLDKVGLQAQPHKTEYWCSADIAMHNRSRLPGTDKSAEGLTVLGTICHFPHGEAAAVGHRIKAMWAVFQRLRGLLRAQSLPLASRLSVLTSTVIQSGLWGLSAVAIKARDLSRLRAAHLAILNRIIPFRRRRQDACGLEPWTEWHVERCRHSYQVCSQHQHVLIDEQWALQYWKWAGHVSRQSRHSFPKALWLWHSLQWWQEQQDLSCGWRHRGKRGNLWRWEAPLQRWAQSQQIGAWTEISWLRRRWADAFPTFLHSLAVRNSGAPVSGKRKWQSHIR